jgi:hypothetical protein
MGSPAILAEMAKLHVNTIVPFSPFPCLVALSCLVLSRIIRERRIRKPSGNPTLALALALAKPAGGTDSALAEACRRHSHSVRVGVSLP